MIKIIDSGFRKMYFYEKLTINLMNNSFLIKVIIVVLITFSSRITYAQKKDNKLDLYGDVRLRSEQDWNSLKTDGFFRPNRFRLRYRFRFGFNYLFNKNVEFGGRLRSGNPQNQQSPHVSFGNEFEPSSVSIDKVYIKYKYKNYWAWGGKKGFPFWKQNELFWDNDVNPEGIAAGGKFMLNDNAMKLTAISGFFVPNNAGQVSVNEARILAFQLNLIDDTKWFSYTFSTGFYSFNDLPNTPDNTGTFLMDYQILNSGLQIRLNGISLLFGFDYFDNLTDYNNNVNINPVFANQTKGYVANITYGKSKKKGDILLAYYYSSIGKYAVVDYFAQDDWVRWGNSNFTRSSNFKGSEISFKYTINKNFNAVIRGFFVDGIKTAGTYIESSNRVRLDLNIKF